jgi:uncharacterized protein
MLVSENHMQAKKSLINRLVQLLLFSTLMLLETVALAQRPSMQPAKGVLWEINSASNKIYLFGSIHLAKADFYPLPAAVEAAYRQASTLAVEADPTDPMAIEKAMPLLTYAAPDKLENHLSEQTWHQLKAMTGPAVETLQTMRPATLAMAFTLQFFAQQGYEPKYGFDLHFIHQAKAERKKVVELEGMEFQASVLGGLSDADGDAMVGELLRGLRSGALQRETKAMIAAWKSGNAQRLAAVLREAANKDDGSKKIMKRLLDDRNIGMAQKITSMLKAGEKAFIVVGAGHIVGENSVVKILQQQGFQVRQIK